MADSVVCSSLEDVDLGLFQELGAGDMVFFDGSHRCFQNSDVTVFFLDVLPRLHEGTVVGLHDIFWPMDYPKPWIGRYYNEQYVLAAYILGMGVEFPLIFSCMYSADAFADRLERVLDRHNMDALKKLGIGIGGGALWFSKPATRYG